jgi:hypothetical protein
VREKRGSEDPRVSTEEEIKHGFYSALRVCQPLKSIQR